jgi:hypothetical protein
MYNTQLRAQSSELRAEGFWLCAANKILSAQAQRKGGKTPHSTVLNNKTTASIDDIADKCTTSTPQPCVTKPASILSNRAYDTNNNVKTVSKAKQCAKDDRMTHPRPQ